MTASRRLLILVAALAIAAGVTLAQGPKRDVGTKLDIPDAPVPVQKPQQKSDKPQASALSIDVDLVDLDVVVTDKDGNQIGGLTKSNFKIFDDNVEQKITNFSPTDEPLTVVIVVEFRESLTYYYDNARGPAAGFINSLRPEDWSALVAFDQRPTVMTDFTRDKNQLFDGLRRLQFPISREVCLYDALWDTLDRMEDVDGKKGIFLLSTGLDTLSKHGYPDLLKKAQASDTVIYPVSLGQALRIYLENQGMSGEDNIGFLQADNVLRSLAQVTGGTAFFPKFAQEYPGIYNTVSTYLRNQYSLGFVPSNRTPDGKFHKLRVEVPPIDINHDGKPDKLKVNAKLGYYAAKP